MNFELDSYVDALKDFPSKEIQIETLDNTYYHFKSDVFKGLVTFSTSQNFGANLVTITARRAKEVILQNKKGQKPEFLDDHADDEVKPVVVDYENGVGQDSLTRFDTNKKRPKGNPNNKKNNQPRFQKPNREDSNPNNPRFQKPIKKNDAGEIKNEN